MKKVTKIKKSNSNDSSYASPAAFHKVGDFQSESPSVQAFQLVKKDFHSSATTLPMIVNAAAQNQTQAFVLAMAYYLPSAKKARYHFTDLTFLISLSVKQPALQKAMDTMSLAQIGTANKDPKLLAEARQSYGQALRSFAATLAYPDARVRNDKGMIATTLVLSQLVV